MAYCKTVWLIDDEEMSHYISKKIIQGNEFSSEIRSFTTASEALAALEPCIETGILPDFIFLDLNLPVSNGWDFLNNFRQLPVEVRQKSTLYILSSSIHEEDIVKSKLYEEVRDFISKPLRKQHLEVIRYQDEVRRKLNL